MKYLFAIFIIIILTNSSICQKQPKYFKILEATKQKIYPGRQEAGWTEKYSLKILPFYNSTDLIFDSLWINNKGYQVQTFQKGKRVKNNTFGANDTVYITVSEYFAGNWQHKTLPKISLPPFKYQGEGLLAYKFKSKRYYFVIEKFNKLPEIYYP